MDSFDWSAFVEQNSQNVLEPDDPLDDFDGFYSPDELYVDSPDDPLFTWFPPSQSQDDPTIHRLNLSDLRSYLETHLHIPLGRISSPGLVILPLSSAFRIRYDSRRRANPPLLVYIPDPSYPHPDLDNALLSVN